MAQTKKQKTTLIAKKQTHLGKIVSQLGDHGPALILQLPHIQAPQQSHLSTLTFLSHTVLYLLQK
jgi:hypothetical protein